MKIKKWLIHKLGGVSKEEIFPPPQYTITYPSVETFRCNFVGNSQIPEEYAIDKLIEKFIPMIKEKMKINISDNGYGTKYYVAEIDIVSKEN